MFGCYGNQSDKLIPTKTFFIVKSETITFSVFLCMMCHEFTKVIYIFIEMNRNMKLNHR